MTYVDGFLVPVPTASRERYIDTVAARIEPVARSVDRVENYLLNQK